MFTIYTFGDPQLLREALLALATVFGLSEWWDGTSGFGLGGNMLAVALIGLMGVAIAGITTQQVRLDYLLVALILFGVGFGSKTSVQVEDIQTGASYVVADIPIGIAAVAAAASSAARNLTETMGTALQRPGTTTSLLTDAGFLDPLRTLYALRTISFQEINPILMKSLLEYYRTCVGYTLANSPATFSQAEFQRSANPFDYLLNPANVSNWTVVYYSSGAPEGTVTTCHDAAASLETDVDTMTSAGADELVAKIRLTMGTKLFDSSFQYNDLNDAADIVSRSIFDGQDFMKAALMRNFVNVAEAWRLADYGDNAAKFSVEVTGALEQQRLASALQGTIWLQMMFPMMTFFQFVFFALAPFIALIVVASPFTAGKTLGGYFLFGVWSYVWMPVAAVVNHYIQITLGNALEYADVAAMGTHYTAIVGMDDFYNQLANKLTIGSNALAAVPMIVGSILFLSFQGLTSLGSKMSQSSAATRVSSNVSAPTPGVSAPLVQAGGLVQYDVGQRRAAGGVYTAPTMQQRIWGGSLISGQTTAQGVSAARSLVNQRQQALTAATTQSTQLLQTAMQQGTVAGQRVANFETKAAQSSARALRNVVTEDELNSLSAGQVAQIESRLGVGALGSLVGKSNTNSTGNAAALSKIESYLDSNEAGFRADWSRGMAEAYRNEEAVSGAFSKAAGEIDARSQELKDAKSLESTLAEQAQYVASQGTTFSMPAVDAFKSALLGKNGYALMADVDASLTQALGSEKGAFDEKVREEYVRGGNYLGDFGNDHIGRLVATNLALSNSVRDNPRAVGAMLDFHQALGIGAGARSDRAGVNIVGAGDQLDGAAEFGAGVSSGVRSGPKGYGAISAESARNRSAGGAMPVVPEGAGSAVEAQFAANRGAVADGDFRDLNFRLASGQAAQGNYIQAAFRASSTRQGVGGELQAVMTQTPGWKKAVDTLPAAMAGTPGATTASLGALRAEMMDSGYVGLNGENDPRALHQGFMARGLDEKQALIATFAAVGPRQAGGEDYLGAVVGGVIGLAGPKKAGLALGRMGAVGVGAMAGLAAGGVYQQNAADQRNAVSILRDQFKTEFAVANAGNTGLISAFNSSMDLAGSLEEMTTVVTERQFMLTDEQLNRVENTLYADSGAKGQALQDLWDNSAP